VASSDSKLCLQDTSCGQGESVNIYGDCVVPAWACEEGYTVEDHCELCLPGYKDEQGYCVDLPNPENCLEVEMTNPERTCAVCIEGYVEENGQCVVQGTPEGCDSTTAVDSYGDGCDA